MIYFKGMAGRQDFEQAKSNQRIEKLAGFQIKILRGALTRYPNTKRVVYSTCSVFPEENEDVVRQVLETNSSYKLVPAMNFVNNTWKNFGSPEFGDIGSYCLYAKSNEDFTNGFFVAVFEKLEEGEENQFFNTKIYNFKKHVQSQENRRRKQQQQMYGNGDGFEESSVDQNQFFGNTNNCEVKENVQNDNKQVVEEDFVESDNSVKKKKKKKNKVEEDVAAIEDVGDVGDGKKRKKRKASDTEKPFDNENGTTLEEEKDESNKEFSESGEKKKKKKKGKNVSEDLPEDTVESNDISSVVERKSKKKKKTLRENDVHSFECEHVTETESNDEYVKVKKGKKKKNKEVHS